MQAAIGQWAQVFPNPTLGWDDLARLREWTALPVLVKGVLHPDDARRAVDEGADGVVVSNHGGRQIDGSATPLGQLPAVVDAVGDDAAVLMDGGVRTGSDVLKAVALGARAGAGGALVGLGPGPGRRRGRGGRAAQPAGRHRPDAGDGGPELRSARWTASWLVAAA